MYTIHDLADLLISQLGYNRISSQPLDKEKPEDIDTYANAHELLAIGDGYQIKIIPLFGKPSSFPKNIYSVTCNSNTAAVRTININKHKVAKILPNLNFEPCKEFETKGSFQQLITVQCYLLQEHPDGTPRSLKQAAVNIFGNAWLQQNNKEVMKTIAKILNILPEPLYQGKDWTNINNNILRLKQVFGCYYILFDDIIIDTSGLCAMSVEGPVQPDHFMIISKIPYPK